MTTDNQILKRFNYESELLIAQSIAKINPKIY